MPVELWKAKRLNYRLITTASRVLQVTILSLGPLIANIGVKCCLFGTFMVGLKVYCIPMMARKDGINGA